MLISQIPLFKGFSEEEHALLEALLIPYECSEGTVLFEQDDRAEYLYLLMVGEVAIYFKPYDGPKILVCHIRPGGVVGWSAATGRRTYTSAAVCKCEAQMLRMRGADLQRLIKQHPATGSLLLERMAATIAQRVPGAHDQVVAMLENGLRKNANKPGV